MLIKMTQQTWSEWFMSWIITPRPSEHIKAPLLHPILEEKIQIRNQMNKYDEVINELKTVLGKRKRHESR